MRLVDLETTHPGGWADILTTIHTKWPDLAVSRTRRFWGLTTKKVDAKGVEVETGTTRLAPRGVDSSMFKVCEYLANLDWPVSGMLASEAYGVLLSCGLPVPGDRQWLKPASTWEREDA